MEFTFCKFPDISHETVHFCVLCLHLFRFSLLETLQQVERIIKAKTKWQEVKVGNN